MVEHIECVHEEQIMEQSRAIERLETRANYKEKMIEDLSRNIEKMSKKIDNIDNCVNDLKLQSKADDFNIDNRVTQLETTQSNLKWAIGIGLTAVGTGITILAFLIAHLH